MKFSKFESLWTQGWNPLYLPLCIFRPSYGPVLWQDRDVKCRQHCSVQSCRGYYYFLKKVQPFVQAGNSSSGHIWVCLQVNIHENCCHLSHKMTQYDIIYNQLCINLPELTQIVQLRNLQNNLCKEQSDEQSYRYLRFNWRNYFDLILNDL
jgi:hypothetical protein